MWSIHSDSKSNVHHESIYRQFDTEAEAIVFWHTRPGEDAAKAQVLEEFRQFHKDSKEWGMTINLDDFKREKGIE